MESFKDPQILHRNPSKGVVQIPKPTIHKIKSTQDIINPPSLAYKKKKKNQHKKSGKIYRKASFWKNISKKACGGNILVN